MFVSLAVHYRVFALTSDMKPINDKEGLINVHIVVQYHS